MRSFRRERHQDSFACRGTIGAIQVDKASRRGRRIVACWATTDGRIHTTAAGDQSRGWCAPPIVEDADSGSCPPDPAAPAPCFSPTSRRTGADDGAAADSDDDATDLAGDQTSPASDSPKRTTAVEPIPPFSKCAILLVFVAQSKLHRCKSYVGFSFRCAATVEQPRGRDFIRLSP